MRPRLNPFALPSETTLRFVLLIVAVLGTSIFISNWLYFTLTNSRREVERIGVCLQAERTATQTTGDALFGGQILQACMAPGDHQKARWMLAGPAGALLLGGALYLGWPAAMRRRRQLRPLAPDVPQVADAVAALSREAGLRRAPEVLWNPMRSAGGAIAFGTPWRPCVALSAGMVAACLRDRVAFDAVLRHELAHLRNGDVGKTYFAIAVWWALVLGGITPLLITLPGNDGVPSVLWRLAVLALLVYLTRNAIVRSRETYADLRASTWDGPGGALRRVLEAMPASPAADPLRRLFRRHPEPAERRRNVDDPSPLFRFDAGSAFLAGAAAGVAFPNVVNLLRLFTTGTSVYGDVNTLAALIVAPWLACVLTVAAWRATQAELAGGARASTVVPALALALGLALGETLSLDAIANVDSGAAGVGRAAFAVLWMAALTAAILLFARWLVISAAAWMPLAGRSPRRVLAAACVLSSLVLAWGFGQLAALGFFLGNVGESGALALFTRGELSRTLVDLVSMKDVTFALLVSLWAFPLAALLLRRGARPRIGSWAYLDDAPVREPPDEPAVLPLKPALLLAAVAGAAYLALLVIWRAAIHGGVPLSERDTDDYILSFVYRAEWIAVALQAGVAVVVVLRARSGRVPLALLAAFLTGVLTVVAMLGLTRVAPCVDALTIRPGGLGCPAPMETSFMWTTLKDWVDEGTLLAVVVLPLALVAQALARRRAAQLTGATVAPQD